MISANTGRPSTSVIVPEVMQNQVVVAYDVLGVEGGDDDEMVADNIVSAEAGRVLC